MIANKTEITETDIATNISSTSSSNCEAAQELITSYGVFRVRWNKYGKSRVRAKHLLALGRPDIINKAKEKFNFCTLSKQYFASPYHITSTSSPSIDELNEIEAVDQAVIWPPLHNQDAIGRSGIIVVYEHDWYGWPRTAYWEPDPNAAKVKLLYIQQNSPWEY